MEETPLDKRVQQQEKVIGGFEKALEEGTSS